MATFFMKSGRYSEAEAELFSANRIQPLPKSFEMLSEIRASKGDVSGAVAYLDEALKQFPEMDQEAVLWMVDLRIREGRVDLAEQVLSQWRSRLTRPALLDTCEGKLAAARGEEDRAIARFLDALSKEPALAQAALAAAPLLHARRRLAELQPILERALTTEKRIDEYQNLLGVILLERGRPEPAMEAIAQALAVDPSNPRFLENFASAAFAAHKPDLAIERYRAALQIPASQGSVWAGYGRVLGMTGQPAEAAVAFEKAREQGDRSAAMYLGYASALYQSGRRDRSREVAREGLRAFPSDPALLALNQRLGQANDPVPRAAGDS